MLLPGTWHTVKVVWGVLVVGGCKRGARLLRTWTVVVLFAWFC